MQKRLQRSSIFCFFFLSTVLTFSQNIGINTLIPADRLHIVGEARIENSIPRLKFYSGATQKAFFQHSNNDLILSNIDAGYFRLATSNINRLSIDGSGNVGVGTSSPDVRLDIGGTNSWDLATSEGDLRLGNSSYRLKFGIALGGAGIGTARIYASGGANKLILGTGTSDRMTITGSAIGIGNITPLYGIDVVSDNARSISLLNTYTGTSSKYGINVDVDEFGSGVKYGVYSSVLGTANDASSIYGVRGYANGQSNTGAVYAIYAQVAAPGTGNHYGIYTTANTTDPSPTTKSWALYAAGNSYFSNEVRIGNLNGATGYKLSVDGKIMAEEIKVQMSGNWPDYVFKKDYPLPELSYVRQHINEHGHLPGVPSSYEIEEDEGFHVGEMNKILLQKIEELTLYILQQDERIKKLEETRNK